MKKRSVFCLLITLVLMAFATTAWAQGKISGKIVDQQSNDPLAGANITLVGTNLGAAADPEGFFVILNVPPGVYQLRATMIGYGKVVQENVQVSSNQTTTINFNLSTEAIGVEEVVIRAERPVVQLDVSSSQKIVTAQAIQSRPVDNLEEVLALEVGVALTAGADGQGLVVRGGQLSETDIVIDGLSTRNRRNQQANTNISLTAIQEIELLTGGFNAEFGEVRSGRVNVITKEGSLDRYSVSFDGRISPPARKHFGPSPFGTDGPWWQVYAGADAYEGVTPEMVEAGLYPFTFIGWNAFSRGRIADSDPNNDLTPQQGLEIWKWQHRKREYANKPDYIGDIAISGQVPFAPVTFLLSQRYEDLQLMLPMSRNNSVASTTLLKLTHRVSPTMKLSLNNNYIVVNGVSAGFFDQSTGIVTGTEVGNEFALQNAGSGEGGAGSHIWFDGSFNPIETKQYRGGLSLNHLLSPKTFYDLRVEATRYTTRQEPRGSRDFTPVFFSGDVALDEAPRGFPGFITEQFDILGNDFMSGGGRGQDHSEYWGVSMVGDLVSQVHKYHEVKLGFAIDYTKYKERREENHGAVTEPREDVPWNWSYYNASPLKLSAYVQDKLEFEGMIANIGVRLDYLSSGLSPFNLDPGFIFANNPYTLDVYQANGNSFESLSTSGSGSKAYLQPRLGISHPISDASKLFFNYGHFLQTPLADELFLQTVESSGNGGRVPNLGADWPRTVAYEVGLEQGIGDDILVHLTGYYKDASDELTEQRIVSLDGVNDVETLANNVYRDIRGVELRLEKRSGRWWYGFVTAEYFVQSQGLTGRAAVFEDRQLAEQQKNAATQIRTPGVPSLRANITMQTPSDFGPMVFGNNIAGGWRLNVLQEWQDGGQSLLNSDAPLRQQIFVDVIDSWNTDILLEKRIALGAKQLGFFMQVRNLFNNRGMVNPRNYNQYVDSLHFPHETGAQKGNDKLGDWDKDYIDIGWATYSQFINPRDIFLGLRFNF